MTPERLAEIERIDAYRYLSRGARAFGAWVAARGEGMIMNYAATVLLSGGLDSVAALHWAAARWKRIDAVFFDYGQANRDQEFAAAGLVARRRGVPLTSYMLGEAVRGHTPLRGALPGVDEHGISLANLPARNVTMLACAATHAARRWGQQARVRLVIGCNADDAERFPDCRRAFIDAMSVTLSAALRGVVEDVQVSAPWVNVRKAGIAHLTKIEEGGLQDMADSVSCYMGTDCGACDACSLRSSALATAGIALPSRSPVSMIGGDPQRANGR